MRCFTMGERPNSVLDFVKHLIFLRRRALTLVRRLGARSLFITLRLFTPDESDDISDWVIPLKRREMTRQDLIMSWWTDFFKFFF